MPDLKLNLTYPNDPFWTYETSMITVDLDKAREDCISKGRGFVITSPQSSLKKDLKNPDGIYSRRYGATLDDINPFADRYKCECGYLKGRIYDGVLCPKCHHKVKYIDDDISYMGWICLKDPFYIIHPTLFKKIEYFLGRWNGEDEKKGKKEKKKYKQMLLYHIINPKANTKDENGYEIKQELTDDNRYEGIGMLKFKENFDEIMQFYRDKMIKKNPVKKQYYDEIMKERDKVFIQSIPVYSIYLRPFKVDAINFKFEGTNALYNIMSKLAFKINEKNKITNNKKSKNQLLLDLNYKYQELYNELNNVISGKKGQIRQLCGGRYSFSSRDVIVPNPNLRVDEVTLPYIVVLELMQQTLINILQKTYSISYNDAYNRWFQAKLNKDQIIWDIIQNFIKTKNGLPVLVNRNPTMDNFREFEHVA